MRTAPLAALLLLSALTAQAAALEGSEHVTGLQATLDQAGVRLTWDGGDGEGPYTVLRDGAAIAIANDAIYVDELPQPRSTYAVVTGPAAYAVSSRLVALSCPLTGINVVESPPFLLVALHENCLPTGIGGIPALGSPVEARSPGPVAGPVDSEVNYR